MRRDPKNIYDSSFKDESIDLCQLFEVSQLRPWRHSNSEQLVRCMGNSSSCGSDRTDHHLIPQRQPTLIQHSETEQSISDETSSNHITYSINYAQNSPLKSPPSGSSGISGLRCRLTRTRKRRDRQGLKDMIHRNKINNIVRNFSIKLNRNNPFAVPVEMQAFEQQEQGPQWLNLQGITINEPLQRFLDIFFLGINLLCIYFYSLGLAFNIFHLEWAIGFEQWAMLAFIAQFLISIISTRCISGKMITKLKDIMGSYLSESLLIDLGMMTLMAVDLCLQETVLKYLKLLVVLKLPSLLQKMEKLQIYFISTTYKEQYWSLIKIFLFNFCFAHILALALRSIANSSPHNNWMTVKGIDHSSWSEAYIWSYYWAINIMLTVGFGDIAASNHMEALSLIFIETLSCMILAYNINCIGSLISNIRSQDQQKSKKYKIFRSLAQKNSISPQLSLRIGNYIEESSNIKKKFNIEEENRFIDALPRIFKKDYLKQANKSIFQQLFFFTNLADKAVQALAEAIQVSITHPEELIINGESYMNLKILKEGTMGYCCKKLGSLYNGYVIDQVSVAQGESPFLLGLEFINHRRPTFEIKSMQYSIIYGLAYDRLILALRKSRGDYEYFCFLRDKNKYLVDEFEINACRHCKTKHTRFLCPKLHFIPIMQQVINKELHSEKISRCTRIPMQRLKRSFYSLARFHSLNQIPYGNSVTVQASTISKNKQFFVKELRKIERIQTEPSHQKRNFSDYSMVFLNNAAESIKQELSNFLKRENEEDQVWTIALDSMQNFKNYFPNDNPGELVNKFNPERRPTFILLGKTENNPFIQYNNKERSMNTMNEGAFVDPSGNVMKTNTNASITDHLSSLEKY